MKRLRSRILLAVLLLSPSFGNAGHTEDVLACVGTMNTDADWALCRNMMFAPCVTDEIGNEVHLMCLTTQKQNWLSAIEARREMISAKITIESSGALTDLYGQWIAYVGQKCPAIGLKNADISKEAAQLGCEISEAVGIASEFESCLQGSSTAPYCIFDEQ